RRARRHAGARLRQDGPPVLVDLTVTRWCRVVSSRAYADAVAGDAPLRTAFHQQDCRGPCGCRSGCAVLPRSPGVLSDAASSRSAGVAMRIGYGRGAEERAGAALVRGPT